MLGLVGIARDITHLKQVENELREQTEVLKKLNKESQKERAKAEKALREKDVLFKEVHHRVKNNLQIISSLLNLESAALKDNEIIAAFDDSKNRIKTMALIHETLYQSEDLERIDFGRYVEALAAHLVTTYLTDPERIGLSLKCDHCSMNINTAVPLGLIVNELVSNSLKYAFPEKKSGNIEIRLIPIEPQKFLLTVRDDGVGLPADLDVSCTRSLGLRLVSILTNQLQGEMNVQRVGGTTFQITLSEQE